MLGGIDLRIPGVIVAASDRDIVPVIADGLAAAVVEG